MKEHFFNPLDKNSLAQSLLNAFVWTTCRELPLGQIEGAGVYALYYCGPLDFYKPITEKNSNGKWEQPIYVGKAIPPGGRRGGLMVDARQGSGLRNRLREHHQSIELAENLSSGDFSVRYLIVDDIWIPLAENILIEVFKPLWNVVVDGFGIHAPGKGRSRQRRSDWDTLHPGRPWAEELPPGKDVDEIISKVRSFLSSRR